MAELAQLVIEMADDLDRAHRIAARDGMQAPPVTGAQLREHYRDVVRAWGVERALQNARHRYGEQVVCNVLPIIRLEAAAS